VERRASASSPGRTAAVDLLDRNTWAQAHGPAPDPGRTRPPRARRTRIAPRVAPASERMRLHAGLRRTGFAASGETPSNEIYLLGWHRRSPCIESRTWNASPHVLHAFLALNVIQTSSAPVPSLFWKRPTTSKFIFLHLIPKREMMGNLERSRGTSLARMVSGLLQPPVGRIRAFDARTPVALT